MDQAVIDKAVRIATKMAMDGHPVQRIVWIPSTTAAQAPGGVFVITPAEGLSASDTPPWE